MSFLSICTTSIYSYDEGKYREDHTILLNKLENVKVSNYDFLMFAMNFIVLKGDKMIYVKFCRKIN